jgi:hypothetical protein
MTMPAIAPPDNPELSAAPLGFSPPELLFVEAYDINPEPSATPLSPPGFVEVIEVR